MILPIARSEEEKRPLQQLRSPNFADACSHIGSREWFVVVTASRIIDTSSVKERRNVTPAVDTSGLEESIVPVAV